MKGEKKIYEINENDILKHPIWYFPCDDSVDDEASVVPLTDFSCVEIGRYDYVVKTIFFDKNNKKYHGYIYWDESEDIGYLQPTLFKNEFCLTFWNGIREPRNEYIESIVENFGSESFPIKYISEEYPELKEKSGTLEGIYYLGDDDKLKIIALAGQK